MSKCKERKSLPTMSKFSPQNCVFYQIEIRRTMLKKPIRIEYLIKQKPQARLPYRETGWKTGSLIEASL